MTELDLNTGYYSISLMSTSQDMIIIVTEFGKFWYNCPPMGVYTQGNILQDKLYKAISDIEGVITYIDDVSV